MLMEHAWKGLSGLEEGLNEICMPKLSFGPWPLKGKEGGGRGCVVQMTHLDTGPFVAAYMAT